MIICLKTHAKQTGSRTVAIRIQERKPARVSTPCELTCVFQVEAYRDYYLLTLDVKGSMEVACQRCLANFQQDYTNQTILAVCSNDAVAETLMASHECIVAKDHQVNLVDIVADELHLYLPEKHADYSECDLETSGLIGETI